jgi:fibronectin type 3 domain-containing protein
VKVNLQILRVPPQTVPWAPAWVSVSVRDGQTILIWAPPVFDGGAPVKYYKIYRSSNGENSRYLTIVKDTWMYTDTQEAYYYEVSAVNSAG